MDQAKASVLLLGGEIRGDNDEDWIEHIYIDDFPVTLITMAFIEAIMPQRLRVINHLRIAWPPRVNAREGTTVLLGTELADPGDSNPQGVLVGRNPTYPLDHSDLLGPM